MQKKQEAYVAKLRNQNQGEAKAFFEKLKANKNVVELPSGLRYEIVQPGKGSIRHRRTSEGELHRQAG